MKRMKLFFVIALAGVLVLTGCTAKKDTGVNGSDVEGSVEIQESTDASSEADSDTEENVPDEGESENTEDNTEDNTEGENIEGENTDAENDLAQGGSSKPSESKPEGSKPSESKPEAPKPAEPQPEAPKPSEPQPEPPKPAEPQPEAPKPSEPQPDTPEPEVHTHAHALSTTPATCTTDGEHVFICACGDRYSQVIPAKGHSLNAAGDRCEECGQNFLNGVEVDVALKPAQSAYAGLYINAEDAADTTLYIADESSMSAFAALVKNQGNVLGNLTFALAADVTLEGAWTPVYVDGYAGAQLITLEGNNHTLRKLTAPLFAGGFAGKSGIVINNLTIADSQIVSTNTLGSGAFIEVVDSMETIVLNNCHLKDSEVTGSRTGGLIGWTAGYDVQSDGPVRATLTITDCSVTESTIVGNGTVGGINGHAGANAATYTTISNCVINNNTLISYDDSYRVGVVVGTANIGELSISGITESGNSLRQDNAGVEIARPEGQSNLYGRAKLEATGKLIIDGVNIQ